MNSHHLRMFCGKFGWKWPSGSQEEDENVKKFTERQTDVQMDIERLRSEKLTRAFSSGEIKNIK